VAPRCYSTSCICCFSEGPVFNVPRSGPSNRSQHIVKRIQPAQARDEGPRLIPSREDRELGFRVDYYVSLADKMLQNHKPAPK
jgi:hypothetical protein